LTVDFEPIDSGQTGSVLHALERLNTNQNCEQSQLIRRNIINFSLFSNCAIYYLLLMNNIGFYYQSKGRDCWARISVYFKILGKTDVKNIK